MKMTKESTDFRGRKTVTIDGVTYYVRKTAEEVVEEMKRKGVYPDALAGRHIARFDINAKGYAVDNQSHCVVGTINQRMVDEIKDGCGVGYASIANAATNYNNGQSFISDNFTQIRASSNTGGNASANAPLYLEVVKGDGITDPNALRFKDASRFSINLVDKVFDDDYFRGKLGGVKFAMFDSDGNQLGSSATRDFATTDKNNYITNVTTLSSGGLSCDAWVVLHGDGSIAWGNAFYELRMVATPEALERFPELFEDDASKYDEWAPLSIYTGTQEELVKGWVDNIGIDVEVPFRLFCETGTEYKIYFDNGLRSQENFRFVDAFVVNELHYRERDAVGCTFIAAANQFKGFAEQVWLHIDTWAKLAPELIEGVNGSVEAASLEAGDIVTTKDSRILEVIEVADKFVVAKPAIGDGENIALPITEDQDFNKLSPDAIEALSIIK